MEISQKELLLKKLKECCKGVDEFCRNLEASKTDFPKLFKNFKKFCECTKEYSNKISNIARDIPNENTFAGAFSNVVRNMILSIYSIFSDISKIFENLNLEYNKKDYEELFKTLNSTYLKYQRSGLNVLDFNTNYNNYIEEYEKYLMKDVIMLDKNDKYKEIIKEDFRKTIVSTYNKSVSDTKNELSYLLNLENSINGEFKNICGNFLDNMKKAIENLKNYYELGNSSFIRINEEIKNFKENMKFKNYKYPLLSLKIYLNNHGQIKTENYLEKNKGITLETIEKIIENLKNNKIEINDEDLENFEKEKAKKIFREKCSLLTSSDKTIEEIDKDKIIKYITKEGEYPNLFLTELTRARVSDNLVIHNDNTFNFFSEIITIINDIAVKRDNYELFQINKNIGITFFKIDNKKKIYLNYSFKNNEKLNSLDFWLKYASYFIRIEEKKRKYKKPLYLIISDSARDMIDSGFDLKFMNDFIEAAIERFNISQQEKDNIKKNKKEFLDAYAIKKK